MSTFRGTLLRAISISAITLSTAVSARAWETYSRSVKWSRLMTVWFVSLSFATPALATLEGLYCTEDGNSFLIGRRTDGNVFEVRITSWQGMFHCGIEGTANATLDGWLLENQGCSLQLREDDGVIALAVSPREACAPFCGARANLNGLTFPPSSRVAVSPDPSLFEHDLGELNPC